MDERETTGSEAQEPDVELGKIVGVFGIRGEVKLEPYSDFPARYNTLKEVTALFPDGERRRLTSLGARKHKVHILMRFDGITNPNEAETLRGATLVIPRSQRAELPRDHYYISDLVGMDVVTTAGETIGPVTDVWHTPANDVYVTERGTVPAVKEYIRDVDMQRRRIVVAAVPGMFDDTEDTSETSETEDT